MLLRKNTSPPGFTVVDGHLFICQPSRLRRIFRAQARLVLRHSNDDACPTWWSVRHTIVQLCQFVLKILTTKVDFTSVQQVYADILHTAKTCWKAQHIPAPWYASEQSARYFLNLNTR